MFIIIIGLVSTNWLYCITDAAADNADREACDAYFYICDLFDNYGLTCEM